MPVQRLDYVAVVVVVAIDLFAAAIVAVLQPVANQARV